MTSRRANGEDADPWSRAGRIGARRSSREAKGDGRYRFDIIVQGENETVFFDV